MTVSYEARTSIDASPGHVWRILTEPGAYPSWNPTVLGIDGAIAEGERISLRSTLDPKRTFKLRVAEFSPPSRMIWSSGMPLGLFRGARTYSLTPNGDRTEFSMREEFTGLLAPLITKSIPDMTDNFRQFAEALKAAAEARQ